MVKPIEPDFDMSITLYYNKYEYYRPQHFFYFTFDTLLILKLSLSLIYLMIITVIKLKT